MTMVLGRELKKYGVTVNAIAPRARTRMTETVLTGLEPAEGQFDEWDPANIAPVVAWLVSPDAADISGQVFVVNGDKVHLMSGWHRVGRIDNGGSRFTPAELDGTPRRAVRRAQLQAAADGVRRVATGHAAPGGAAPLVGGRTRPTRSRTSTSSATRR